MVGKKAKKSAKPAKEKKPAKKKSKGNGAGAEKLKQFFLLHSEKLVVGVLAAAAAWIIFQGFSLDGLPANQAPADLQQAISSADSYIKQTPFTEVRSVRYPEEDRFDQQATEDTNGIELAAYSLDNVFSPIYQKPQRLRKDPELLAPYQLETKAGYGPIALKSQESGSDGFVNESRDPNLRQIPEQLAQRFRGGGGGEGSMSGGKIESRYFVAVSGLVPLQKQMALYEEAFDGAAEYSLERDMPNYGGVRLQRAEVNSDGSVGQWVSVDDETFGRREPTTWSGENQEVVAEDYVIESLLMPIPPIIGRDMREWSGHSDVEMVELGRGGEYVGRSDEMGGVEEKEQSFNLFGEDFGRGEGEGRGGIEGSGDLGATTPYRGGEGGSMNRLPDSEFVMFRYFDFGVEPGKKYVYRAQVILEDPNDPASDNKKPSTASCDSSVIRRLQEQKSDPAYRQYARFSDWSEASSAVRISSGNNVLTGKVQAPSEDRRLKIVKPGEEPSAIALAIAYDRNRAMDVPAELTVKRGSVLNTQGDLEAVDPNVMRLRKLQGYSLVTNALVLDIDGGKPLNSGELTSPGQILVMMENGDLVFHDELAEVSEFNMNRVPEEELLGEGFESRRMEGEPENETRSRRQNSRNTRRGGLAPERGGGR
ncbi:MAG: hypothetical protein R3C28_05895 [Pirellulaceae bacterium]